MTVCIDTGVLYADHDRDASRHDVASAALDAVFDGELGRPYVSDYVFDEAVTLTLKRAGAFQPAREMGRKIRGEEPYPRVYELRHITPTEFEEAIDVFETYDDQGLSFTDATTIALYHQDSLDGVLSFDDDFDGIVDRVDPGSFIS